LDHYEQTPEDQPSTMETIISGIDSFLNANSKNLEVQDSLGIQAITNTLISGTENVI